MNGYTSESGISRFLSSTAACVLAIAVVKRGRPLLGPTASSASRIV